MLGLASEDAEFWQFYSSQLMGHLGVALEAVGDLMNKDHESRLTSVLLRLSGHRASGGRRSAADPITIHASQSDFAAAANVGRTTANRWLVKLKHAGLVDIAYGRLVILDVRALEERVLKSG